ncbi:hypothetical protein [Streptomyces rimosus]|uniref:hypothetical protein n=1 Tax=Streptomyces rimosus TaxID=1927 RepID=UPI0004C4D81B|nr:hypothetical protein [Streptomyces rimosus]
MRELPPGRRIEIDERINDGATTAVELRAMAREAMSEVRRLLSELAARQEDIAFTERCTLPELHRTVQWHQDGKKRWRDRAEKVEAERDALQERVTELTELLEQARRDASTALARAGGA